MTPDTRHRRWTGNPTPQESVAWLMDAAHAAGNARHDLTEGLYDEDRKNLADLLYDLSLLLAGTSGQVRALYQILDDTRAAQADRLRAAVSQ